MPPSAFTGGRQGRSQFGNTKRDGPRCYILSEDFLNRVSALEQKNLALETLRKLLTDQIKISERTNLVQVQKFREAKQHGQNLGLSTEEVAFYAKGW